MRSKALLTFILLVTALISKSQSVWTLGDDFNEKQALTEFVVSGAEDSITNVLLKSLPPHAISQSSIVSRLRVVNKSGKDHDVVIKLGKDFSFDRIATYQFENGVLKDKKMSTHFLSNLDKEVPFQHDPHIYSGFPDDSIIDLVFVALPVSGYESYFELTVFSWKMWTERLRSVELFQALFHGMMLTIVVYSLMLFFQVKDRVFLFYATYILSFSVFSAIVFNHLEALGSFNFRPLFFMFSGAFCGVFYVLFLIRFVNPFLIFAIRYRWVANLTRIMILISILGFLGYFFVDSKLLYADWYMRIIIMLSMFIASAISVLSLFRKNHLGTFVFFGTLAVYSGFIAGLITLAFFGDQTSNFAQIGIMVEAIVFSIGLGYRIRIVNEANQNAQKRLIIELRRNKELTQLMNVDLERRVEARTRVVNKQNLEIQRNVEKLQDQNEELNRVNAFKDKLFAIISHDLRSPIKSLKGVLDNHTRGQLGQKELEIFTNRISKSLAGIMAMLDNMLMWALQQSAEIDYNPGTISLKEITRSNIELLLPQALEKKITIRNEVEDKLNAFADNEMIRLVIRNLLSNAIKFTKVGGHIVIRGGIESGEAFLSIEDDGKGIARENIEKIFGDVVYSTSGTANEKGTGLGLRLCKDFVTKNHGTISVDSTLGEGSTFTIRLPSEVNRMIA